MLTVFGTLERKAVGCARLFGTKALKATSGARREGFAEPLQARGSIEDAETPISMTTATPNPVQSKRALLPDPTSLDMAG
jgi:hypothetical protein